MNWRERLRGDPARWLLDDDDNPSVYFWFQRDIVGRPENAPALVRAREKILYSAPAQELLAAQDKAGFWDNSDSLIEPRYRATLWSLALLAELGMPRASRRARAASEFILQNDFAPDNTFAGLLLRTLLYFNDAADPRIARALDAMIASIPNASAGAAVYSAWALAELPPPQRSSAARAALADATEMILDALARDAFPMLGTFPPFDASDALLALRVLALAGRVNDTRARGVIEKIWAMQGADARWNLARSFNGQMAARLEDAGVPSKWATLNALRIVTKL
jgi:hypothetical protein